MADLRIVDAPEIPTENITGEEKLPTGGSGNYSITLDSVADYTKTKKDLVDTTTVDSKVSGVRQELDAHIEDLLNPHQVTKDQIGLGNVDNTADADKPVSNSAQAAIISAVSPKADKTYVDNQLIFKANKADVYTKQESSDLVDNSISTALTPVNDSLDLAKRGVANRYDSSLTYNSGERVVLTNGDIVKSTIDGNVNDPNVDMTGWENASKQVAKFLSARDVGLTKWEEFKKPPYTIQEYEQAYNNGVRLTAAIKAAHDAGYGEVVLERGNYPFLYTNETGGTFTNNRFGAIKVRDVSYMNVNLNGSTMFVIFDSNNRNPYDNATAQAPYQLHGAVFDTENVREVTFSKGIVRGDQYMRSWVVGENTTEQTYGFFLRGNSVGVYFDKVTMTGFRGDGIGGAGRGVGVASLNTWYKGGVSAAGVVESEVGAYNSGLLTIDRSVVIDDSIQLVSTSIRSGNFRDPNLKIFFYREDNSFISSEWVRQCDFIYLPKDCTKINVVAYGDERTDETVSYGNYLFFATGTSDKVYAQYCEFYQNHRGGISNLFGNAVFEKCYFHDIGYGKQGFPNYGDPTRFGIDFENVYVHSLTVRDCVFRNIPQGALGGVRDFIVDNCLLENLEHGGTLAYACSKAIFTGNTYRDVRLAFGYQNSGTYLPKSLVASGNVLERSGIVLDISTYANVKYSIHDNEFKDKCTISVVGDGKNLNFFDNTVYNPLEASNFNNSLVIKGALKSSGNIIVSDVVKSEYDYFGFGSEVGANNNFIDNRNNTTRIREPSQANEVIRLNFLNLISNSNKVYQNRLTNKSKGWAAHVDNYRTTRVGLDNIRYELYGLDGQNHYNTVAVLDEVNFKNNAQVVLSKKETVGYAPSTTDIILKNCQIDLTNATRLIFITYAQLGVCTIKFINCTFTSDTAKSIAFIQGQTANITATATNCHFINVTNTDSILQISGTAKVAYDPPSLENGVQQSTTVTVTGAKLGDNVNVSFDKPLSGTRMWGEVTSSGVVTVYHRNDTGATVDIPSGILSVKLV